MHEPGKETAVSFAPIFADLVSYRSQTRLHILRACGVNSNYRLTAMGFLCYSVHEKSPLCVWRFAVNSLYHIEVDFSSFLVHIILARTGHNEKNLENLLTILKKCV